MKAKDMAKILMEHPDAEVATYGIRGNVESRNLIFNGVNWWIGA
jgi:hypothetical protein